MAAAGDYRYNGGMQDQDYAGEYDHHPSAMYHDQGRGRGRPHSAAAAAAV